MNWSTFKKVIWIIILLLTFGIITQAMVRVKVFELKLHISRKQLLNYELSSGILRARFYKFRNGIHSIKDDVRMSVLESTIMNDNLEQSRLSMDGFETLGLGVANFVRILNFKPLLNIRGDLEVLYRLQFAFYLERKRRFSQAIKHYTAIQDKLQRTAPNDYAFTLLHGAYCKALLGAEKEAALDLEVVIKEFKGTHFADSAITLLALIRANQKRENQINNLGSFRDRAYAYFKSGQFKQAIRNFKRSGKLASEDKFLLALALEQAGEMDEAEEVYRSLVEGASSKKYRKKATRRLWLLGKFLGGGAEVVRYAEKSAKRLGDENVIREFKRMSRLKRKSEVLEKIKKAPLKEENKASPFFEPETLVVIRKDLKENLPADENTVEVVAALKVAEAEKPEKNAAPDAGNVATLTPGEKSGTGKEPEAKPGDEKKTGPVTKETKETKEAKITKETTEKTAKKTALVTKETKETNKKRHEPELKKLPAHSRLKHLSPNLQVVFKNGMVVTGRSIVLVGNKINIKIEGSVMIIDFDQVKEIKIKKRTRPYITVTLEEGQVYTSITSIQNRNGLVILKDNRRRRIKSKNVPESLRYGVVD